MAPESPQRLKPFVTGDRYRYQLKNMGSGLLSLKRLDGYWPEVIFIERESALAIAAYVGLMNKEAL